MTSRTKYTKILHDESAGIRSLPKAAAAVQSAPPDWTDSGRTPTQRAFPQLQQAVGYRAAQHLLSPAAAVGLSRGAPTCMATAQNRRSAVDVAQQGVRGVGVPLPYLETIQKSFGRHDVSGVRAHTDNRAQTANHLLGSVGYTVGDRVAFQGAPSLRTAAHEAAHTVQQQSGLMLDDEIGEAGGEHERNADAVADRVLQGLSSEPLLDRYARPISHCPTVQCKPQVVQLQPMVKKMNSEDLVDAATWDEHSLYHWLSWWGGVARDGSSSPYWASHLSSAMDVITLYGNSRIDNFLTGVVQRTLESWIHTQRSPEIEEAVSMIENALSVDAQDYAFSSLENQAHIADLKAELTQLVREPYRLDQGGYGLCGSVAFLQAVLVREPKIFAQYVLDLLTTGKGRIGDLVVKASQKVKTKDLNRQGRKIRPAHWIPMASLLGSTTDNLFTTPWGNHITKESGSDTKDIINWCERSGYVPVAKRHDGEDVYEDGDDYIDNGDDLPTTKCLFSAASKKQSAKSRTKIDANKLISLGKKMHDHEVLLGVDGRMLNYESIIYPESNHYIRLASPVIDAGEFLSFQVWTWGRKQFANIQRHKVPQFVHAYIVTRVPKRQENQVILSAEPNSANWQQDEKYDIPADNQNHHMSIIKEEHHFPLVAPSVTNKSQEDAEMEEMLEMNKYMINADQDLSLNDGIDNKSAQEKHAVNKDSTIDNKIEFADEIEDANDFEKSDSISSAIIAEPVKDALDEFDEANGNDGDKYPLLLL